jgi:hypothetical protein
MEEMGLGKSGCSVMWVVDCNCSHKNQNIMAMEAINLVATIKSF